MDSSGIGNEESTGRIALSIIVVGWNSLEYIQRCFDSVYKYPPSRPFELIYVDNASEDGSVECINKRHPRVMVIRNNKNLGFQKANNQALLCAKGEFILLLNADTEVLKGTFDTMMNFLSKNPKAGAANPRCIYPDGRLQWTVAGFPTLEVLWRWLCDEHESLKWFRSRSIRRGSSEVITTREQDYTYGAFFMVKSVVVKAIGLMDECFFMVGGDVAWSCEIQKKGWKNFYVAEAEVIHNEGGSRRKDPQASQIDWIKGHRRLLYKYRGVLHGLMGELIFVSHISMNLFRSLWHRNSRTSLYYWIRVLKSVYLEHGDSS